MILPIIVYSAKRPLQRMSFRIFWELIGYIVATQIYQIFYQIVPKSYPCFNYVKKKWINKIPGNSEAEKVIFILENHRMLHGGGGLLEFI